MRAAWIPVVMLLTQVGPIPTEDPETTAGEETGGPAVTEPRLGADVLGEEVMESGGAGVQAEDAAGAGVRPQEAAGGGVDVGDAAETAAQAPPPDQPPAVNPAPAAPGATAAPQQVPAQGPAAATGAAEPPPENEAEAIEQLSEEVRSLRQELEATRQELQALQTQQQTQGEDVGVLQEEQDREAQVAQRHDASREARLELTRTAVAQIDAVRDVVRYGSSDVTNRVDAAVQALNVAAAEASRFGTPRQAALLEQASDTVARVPFYLDERNYLDAEILLTEARGYAEQALTAMEPAAEVQ